MFTINIIGVHVNGASYNDRTQPANDLLVGSKTESFAGQQGMQGRECGGGRAADFIARFIGKPLFRVPQRPYLPRYVSSVKWAPYRIYTSRDRITIRTLESIYIEKKTSHRIFAPQTTSRDGAVGKQINIQEIRLLTKQTIVGIHSALRAWVKKSHKARSAE
ncbi:unnamed protein product, partial [Iphiclides podalirius]